MSCCKLAWYGVLLISLSSEVSAQNELKLMCNLQVKKVYRTGTKELIDVKSIIQINDYATHLSIIPDGDELASVSTHKAPNRNYDNFSDGNKWDLATTIMREGRKTITNIAIDRNTGRIVYMRDWSEGAIVTNGEGSCEKIDTTMRKF